MEVTLKVSSWDPSTSLGMTGTLAQVQMIEKPHAIAYWLLPETTARKVFVEKIRELARQFDAPAFVPHVTVFIAPENSRNPAEVLNELGAVMIDLTIRSIRFSEQFTKTLVVQFEGNDALQELGDNICRASKAPERYIIDPHLSLLYANLALETKKQLAEQIAFPVYEVPFGAICAMRCARPTTTALEVERWRLLASQE
jgi:putative hydrolase of the HAD superfamily